MRSSKHASCEGLAELHCVHNGSDIAPVKGNETRTHRCCSTSVLVDGMSEKSFLGSTSRGSYEIVSLVITTQNAYDTLKTGQGCLSGNRQHLYLY